MDELFNQLHQMAIAIDNFDATTDEMDEVDPTLLYAIDHFTVSHMDDIRRLHQFLRYGLHANCPENDCWIDGQPSQLPV